MCIRTAISLFVSPNPSMLNIKRCGDGDDLTNVLGKNGGLSRRLICLSSITP